MRAATQMTPRRVGALAVTLACALALAVPPGIRAASDTLPDRLSDEAFWKLSQDLSEPDGDFRSDNLLSNEIWYQYTLSDLTSRAEPGGVYLGVGPEQNFTYIAALRPKMVFITDVRRGNLRAHLMYKALFELSKDRVEFVSRLFTKPRPAGLGESSTAQEIFDALMIESSDKDVFDRNAKDIIDHLTKTRKIPLTEADQAGIINAVYYNFYWYGPRITYSSTSGNAGRSSNMATYHDLMVATDAQNAPRSFLASEASFRFLKDLHARNLFVPVVGNFAGPKSLRAVGAYVREHGATVSAFYLSNVEQYLTQDQIWGRFCANVATMPLDDRSTFIRSAQNRSFGGGGGLVNQLGSMKAETERCAGG